MSSRSSVHALADRIAPFGWHIEFLVNLDEAPGFAGAAADLAVPVVLTPGYPRLGRARSSTARLRVCWACSPAAAAGPLTAPYRFERPGSAL
jgi:hypothetical protein